MQLKPTNLVNKTNEVISTAAKKTSWNHGWLHVVVQYVFGAITVTSFILIVVMTMKSTTKSPPSDHCEIHGCRVICNSAPYFGEFEDDIIFAVSEAELRCDFVLLSLTNPSFFNSTIPSNWLARMRSNVHELEIIGGNLNNIASQAFVSQFATQMYRLTLEYVTLMSWSPDMLVGLAHLKELHIKSSNIIRIEKNALQAVDNTLQTLAITFSNYWDPVNVTGQSNFIALSNVVLSSNNFNNILNRRSFRQLQKCRVLFLNSCRINAIGDGTFDYLDSIEMLFLHNNYLVVLPTTLFDNIMAMSYPRPRINLQDNMWVCDCLETDIFRRLVVTDVLLVDAVCHYPNSSRGKSFSEFYNNCSNSTSDNKSMIVTNRYAHNFDYVHMDGACESDDSGRRTVTLISPADFLTCSNGRSDFFLNALPDEALTDRPIKNEILNATFTMKGDRFSIVEIISTGAPDYGLVWYQSKCPHEVYCVNMLPLYLTVYNVDDSAEYTFCPLRLSTQTIDVDRCVFCSTAKSKEITLVAVRITLYFIIGVSCLAFGALCVYMIIRKFPTLLKGSNRILFVKHKNVEALILPPKIPLRNSESGLDVSKNDIFMLSSNKHELFPNSLMRTHSMRSTKSMAPSYISALQPTEEQLNEWRLKHLDDNDSTITSVTFGYPYATVSDDESIFSSLSQTSNRTLESIKQSEFGDNK